MIKKSFASFLLIVFLSGILFTDCNNATKSIPPNTDTIPKIAPKKMGIPGNFITQTKIRFDSTIIKKNLDSFQRFKIYKKGKLDFRKDIDDRNSRLAKMIFEKPVI
ncbi:MAG: hypothetical protein JWP81_4195 [Ferruginibacter sp.]|nr:hypothetical protein [Ferruginibacter sp.]